MTMSKKGSGLMFDPALLAAVVVLVIALLIVRSEGH